MTPKTSLVVQGLYVGLQRHPLCLTPFRQCQDFFRTSMATWHPLRQVGTPPADSLVVDSLLDNLRFEQARPLRVQHLGGV